MHVLSAVVGAAVTLGFIGLTGAGASIGPAPVQAQAGNSGSEPDDASARISAADQRKEMIGQLKNLSVRMERIESLLSRGINVKVTQMPAAPGEEPAPAERAAPVTTPRLPTVSRPSSR